MSQALLPNNQWMPKNIQYCKNVKTVKKQIGLFLKYLIIVFVLQSMYCVRVISLSLFSMLIHDVQIVLVM